MRWSLLCLVGLVAPLAAKWQPLGEDGFKEALSQNDYTLAAYISTQNSQKDFEKFQEEWAAAQSSVDEMKFISIDCSANQEFCHEHDVASLPTIRLYRQDGQFERYRGDRKSKDITAFLRRMSRPIVSSLSGKNASSFKSTDDIVLIANLKEGDGELEERLMEVAKQYHDRYSFAIRPRKAHGMSLDCINNVNFEQLSITDLSDPLAIENLIRQCTRPLIPEFTRRNEGELAQAGKSIVHYLTSSDEDRESYASAMRTLAKKYKEYLTFVTTDVTEYPDMLPMVGHRPGSDSVLAVVNPNAGSVFPYRGKTITPETVEAFLSEISSGSVKPWDGSWGAPESEQTKRDEL